MGRCLDTNDSEEVSFAVEVLNSHIRDHYAAHPASKILRATLDELISAIPSDIFFASFTQNPDLLSQWRGYAPDKGVSFGFSHKHLKSLSISFGLKFGIVLYKYDDQCRLIDEIARDFLNSFSVDALSSDRLRSRAFERFVSVAPFLKHGAFFEECEWRLVYIPDGTTRLQPQNRVINGNIKTIVELPIDPILYTPNFTFGSIYTSPTLSVAEGLGEVYKIMAEYETSVYHVQMSSIPYQRSKL